MATDLTFEQLNTALGVPAIAVDAGASENILINVNAIIGITGTPALTDEGVIEFLAKLFYAAREAQATVNTTANQGERLDAFLQPVSQLIGDGSLQVTQQMRFRMLPQNNLDEAYGPQA